VERERAHAQPGRLAAIDVVVAVIASLVFVRSLVRVPIALSVLISHLFFYELVSLVIFYFVV
jgi:hypothetical protein